MLDGQYALDGFLFGRAEDAVTVLTGGLDTPSYEIRNQDTPAPQGDSVFFGRDYLTPPTWTFTLAVKDDVNVYPVLNNLAAAWRADSKRTTPGALSTLTYMRNGEPRRVYGRPRQFTVDHGDVIDHTFKLVTATFTLADNFSYSEMEHSLTLGLVETSQEDGLLFPADFPWEFVSDGFTRTGQITITASLPTPFIVAIAGPVTGQATNFSLRSTTGWQMDFGTYLSAHGNIRVDTSTGDVRRNSATFGGSIRQRADYRARLQPGPQELIFTANDPTYTTSATIRWRDVSPLY